MAAIAPEDRLYLGLKGLKGAYQIKIVTPRTADTDAISPYRKISLRSDSRLDKDGLMLLAMLYQKEQSTASALSAFAHDDGDLAMIWPVHSQLLHEYHINGVKEMLTL